MFMGEYGLLSTSLKMEILHLIEEAANHRKLGGDSDCALVLSRIRFAITSALDEDLSVGRNPALSVIRFVEFTSWIDKSFKEIAPYTFGGIPWDEAWREELVSRYGLDIGSLLPLDKPDSGDRVVI